VETFRFHFSRIGYLDPRTREIRYYTESNRITCTLLTCLQPLSQVSTFLYLLLFLSCYRSEPRVYRCKIDKERNKRREGKGRKREKERARSERRPNSGIQITTRTAILRFTRTGLSTETNEISRQIDSVAKERERYTQSYQRRVLLCKHLATQIAIATRQYWQDIGTRYLFDKRKVYGQMKTCFLLGSSISRNLRRVSS